MRSYIDTSLRSVAKGGPKSMAKIILATLCDDVREEKTGKFSLMGLFDRFLVTDFRAPLPPFWLFVQIGCETEGEHSLSVELRRVLLKSLKYESLYPPQELALSK